MKIEITESNLDVIDATTQKLAERVIHDEVAYYLEHFLEYHSEKWPFNASGEKAINYMIRDAISLEVSEIIRKRIDEITKKAVTQTAQSIRANKHYDELRRLIVEMLHEEDK